MCKTYHSSSSETNLLAIDLDGTVNDKLASLSYTAGEQCTENSRVQSTLERRKSHLHVRRHLAEMLGKSLVDIAESSSSLARVRRGSRSRASPGGLGVAFSRDGGGGQARTTACCLLRSVVCCEVLGG